MIALAIDTSGVTASAAIVDEFKTIAEFSVSCALTHSQTVMPMIDQLVKMTGFDLNSVDFIACVSGPGSFTGLRIGAACAKGLAAGLSKKLVAVPTLDALAYNVFRTDAYIAPIMDARRGQVYAAFYKNGGSRLERVSEYLADDFSVIGEMAEAFDSPVIFLGDGVLANSEAIAKNKNFYTAPPNSILQRAASVGALAIEIVKNDATVMSDPREFQLMYVRKPQAEREYEERRGL